MSLVWEKLSLCCQRLRSRLKRLFPSEGKTGKVGQIFRFITSRLSICHDCSSAAHSVFRTLETKAVRCKAFPFQSFLLRIILMAM